MTRDLRLLVVLFYHGYNTTHEQAEFALHDLPMLKGTAAWMISLLANVRN